MKRPELSRALTPEQFQENYYLKEELQAFLKACGVSASGSKADLNERILQILHGNAICSAVKQRKVKNNRTDTLCPDSIIEKDLVCSQKHRAFFKSVIEIGRASCRERVFE